MLDSTLNQNSHHGSGIPFNFNEDTFDKSRSEALETIIDSCREFFQKNAQALVGFHPDTSIVSKSIGQCLIDPVAEIKKADSVTTLISIAREWVSDEIATDLSKINEYPLEDDELPLNINSLKNMLHYSFLKGITKPIITATHDGLLQADWDSETEDDTVAIRFLANEKAWVTIQTEDIWGTFEIKISSLLSEDCPINLPSWANE